MLIINYWRDCLLTAGVQSLRHRPDVCRRREGQQQPAAAAGDKQGVLRRAHRHGGGQGGRQKGEKSRCKGFINDQLKISIIKVRKWDMYLKAVAGREKCVTDLLHFSTYMSEKSNKTLDGRTETQSLQQYQESFQKMQQGFR